jgi:hypothetical protein
MIYKKRLKKTKIADKKLECIRYAFMIKKMT